MDTLFKCLTLALAPACVCGRLGHRKAQLAAPVSLPPVTANVQVYTMPASTSLDVRAARIST